MVKLVHPARARCPRMARVSHRDPPKGNLHAPPHCPVVHRIHRVVPGAAQRLGAKQVPFARGVSRPPRGCGQQARQQPPEAIPFQSKSCFRASNKKTPRATSVMHLRRAPVDELRWPKPVSPGDILKAKTEVLSITPSQSRPAYGVVRLKVTASNQLGQIVCPMIPMLWVLRRPER